MLQHNELVASFLEQENDDEYAKDEHVCGECQHVYFWSADDIAWKYEASPFMPCGHSWDMLDRVF